MKTKSFVFCCLCIVLLICNACEEPMIQNKYNDNTKLWPAYDSISSKMGYINEKGEMVIPPQFKSAGIFINGLATVWASDPNAQSAQFIDTKGNVVYTVGEEVFDSHFYNGYLKFHKYFPPSYDIAPKYGLYDSNFNVVLPDMYKRLGNMSKEGLVATEYGYYNKKGELALTLNADTSDVNATNEIVYSYGDFCDGVAVINITRYKKGQHTTYSVGAINTKGEWVIDTTLYRDLRSVGGGLLAYMDTTSISNGLYPLLGLMDTHGNKLTEPIFLDVKNFEDDNLLPAACVKYNEYGEYSQWGYVDKTGTIRIEPQFIYCEPFHEGVAWACKSKICEEGDGIENDYCLIDTQGNILIDFGKDVMPCTCSHNGLIGVEVIDRVNKKNIFKYIDKNNNTIYSWEHDYDKPETLVIPYLMLPSRVPKNEQK